MSRQKKAPARGRQQGRKNLKTNAAGNLVNQHGVVFTPDEKRLLVNAVNRANAKRRKMLKEAATAPRMVGGKPTGDTGASLQFMGRESDFIIAKKTKSLQRFTSKADYNRYMKYLDRVNDGSYLTERAKLYKSNFMKALKNTYGDDAMDIYYKVRRMNPDKYRELVEQSGDDLEIWYVYHPEDMNAKLNQMRAALGMELKESWEEYE